jgi:citrate lyase subunit beta/citryl-CoA lyase
MAAAPAALSNLFVPGTNSDLFGKALRARADAVIVDLEDGVSSERRDEARAKVAAWLSPDHPVYVRVNAANTAWHDSDLAAIARPGLAGVVLPKAEDPAVPARLAAILPEGVRVLPVVETALGLWRALDLARAPGVERLAFGSIDFQLDTGIEGEDDALLYARSHLVIVSRLAGLPQPVDGITAAIDDLERLRAETIRARKLGFGAKLCVHPKQVPVVNAAFSPSEEEERWARRVLAATEAEGNGAFRLGDEMIDRPVVERAKRILARVIGGNRGE